MKDILSSINIWINERTSNGVYLTFFFFSVTWNWKFFYLIFLENKELLDYPRFFYLETYFTLYLPSTGVFVLDNFLQFITNFSLHLLPPLIFTCLFIQYSPRFYNWAHDKSTEAYFLRKENYDSRLSDYESNKTKALRAIAEEKTQQQQQIRKIEQTTSLQQEVWLSEYQEFKKSNYLLFSKLEQIQKSFFEYGGRILLHSVNIINGPPPRRVVDVDILTQASLRDLILIEGSNENQRITLTEKGKFFLANFTTKK